MSSFGKTQAERIYRWISEIWEAITGVGGISVNQGTPGPETSPWPVIDVWRIGLVSDEGVDDNDKTVINVPVGEEIQILWVWAEVATTATPGNRQLEIQILDTDNDVIARFVTGVTQAASLTRHYLFAPGMSDLTAFRDTNLLTTPIPPTLILRAGDKLRIFDNNNIDANDDIVVQAQIAEREI